MIEIYLKYDNMHTFGIINAFICINNHINLCINSMLSMIQFNKFILIWSYILKVMNFLIFRDFLSIFSEFL